MESQAFPAVPAAAINVPPVDSCLSGHSGNAQLGVDAGMLEKLRGPLLYSECHREHAAHTSFQKLRSSASASESEGTILVMLCLLPEKETGCHLSEGLCTVHLQTSSLMARQSLEEMATSQRRRITYLCRLCFSNNTSCRTGGRQQATCTAFLIFEGFPRPLAQIP